MEEPVSLDRGRVDIGSTLRFSEKNDYYPATQVQKALSLKDGWSPISNKLAELGVKISLSNTRAETRLARNFLNNRFKEEVNLARENGEYPDTTIAGADGCWRLVVAIEPINAEDARGKVRKGLSNAIDANEKGLLRILKRNNELVGTDNLDEASSPLHWSEWSTVLALHRDAETGESFKELRVYRDWKGNLQRREIDSSKPEDLFDIVEATEDSMAEVRDFSKVIKNEKVGRVILLKDQGGMVKKVEIEFNHINNDGEHGLRILGSVMRELNEDANAELIGTDVLRVNKKDDYTAYTIDTTFKLSEEEKYITYDALAIFPKRMNLSVRLAEDWLIVNGGESGYICVTPGKEERAAGLQFALLPSSVSESKHINVILDDYLSGKIAFVGNLESVALRVTPKFETDWKGLNDFMQGEINYAQKGMSSLAVASAYAPRELRKIVQNTLKKQNKILAEGSFQASSLQGFDKYGLKNVRFTTAHNISTTAVEGISNLPDKKYISLSMRTTKEDYKEAKKRLRGLKMFEVEGNIEWVLKQMAEEKVYRYRVGTVIMSFVLLARHYHHNLPESERKNKLEDLYNKTEKALKKIQEERHKQLEPKES